MPPLVLMAVLLAPAQAEDPDLWWLKSAGISADGRSLLTFFRERSGNDVTGLSKLIQLLGDEAFDERERAAKAVVAIGPAALPQLRAALKDGDAEISRRAKDCLQILETKERLLTSPVYEAALRRLAKLNPDETVAVLLAYLPHAPRGEVEEETWRTLGSLAGKPGNLHPLIANALKHKSPGCRALAACLAARLGSAPQKEMVRQLLKDPEPLVRLRAAQGFLTAGEASGVPTLISLLETAPIEVAWQAEELLHWLAEWHAPLEVIGAGEVGERARCRAAWQAWFKKWGAPLDVAKLLKEPRRPALYLIGEKSQFGSDRHSSTATLYGCDSVPRWHLDKLPNTIDLNWDSTGSLLLAEASDVRGGRITKRTLQGKVVWDYDMEDAPFCCVPVADGNLFLSYINGMREVRPDKTEVFRHRIKTEFAEKKYQGVARLPNGNTLYRADEGHVLEFKPNDTVARKFQIEFLRNKQRDQFSRADRVSYLQNGHFLIVDRDQSAIIEADLAGKTLSRLARQESIADIIRPEPGRLALAGSGNTFTDYFTEIDYTGRACLEVFTQKKIHQIRSCFRPLRFGFPEPSYSDGDVTTFQRRLHGLDSPIDVVRGGTATMIRELGHAAQPAIPQLIRLLGDKDDLVRIHAKFALARMGPAAIPPLVDAMQDKDDRTREEATEALKYTKIFPSQVQLERHERLAIPELLKNLKDPNAKVRRAAADAFSQMGPEARVAESLLIELVEAEDQHVLHWALTALANLEPQSPRVVEVILKACRSRSAETRRVAVERLQLPSLQRECLLPALIDALKDKDGTVRYFAADSVREWGPKAKAAVPTLMALCSGGVPGTTRENELPSAIYFRLLARVGPAAPEIIPFLIAKHKEDDDLECLIALKPFGPLAKDAVPLAEKLLAKGNVIEQVGFFRERLEILSALGPAGAEALIRRVPQDPKAINKEEFADLLYALALTGPAGKPVVPRLLELLKDESVKAEYEAEILSVFGGIGPEARDAMPTLLRALRSDKETVSQAAAVAIHRIAPKDEIAIKALRDTMLDASRPVSLRLTICAALCELGADARPLVSDIVKFLDSILEDPIPRPLDPVDGQCMEVLWTLNDKNRVLHLLEHDLQRHLDSRSYALTALAFLGKDATAALPRLEQIVREHKNDSEVRTLAACALSRMGTDGKAAAPTLGAVLVSAVEPSALRRQAAIALSHMGPAGVTELTKALESKDWTGRLMAVTALEDMGPSAKDALPAIRALSRGEDKLLARAAEFAIKKIEK